MGAPIDNELSAIVYVLVVVERPCPSTVGAVQAYTADAQSNAQSKMVAVVRKNVNKTLLESWWLVTTMTARHVQTVLLNSALRRDC